MEGGDQPEINVQIRQSSGANFDIKIKADQTIEEMKQICQESSSIPAAEQRLIFKGKILKDDQKLVDYKIEDGMTVHLVKSAKPPSSQGASSNVAAPTQNVGNPGAPAG